MYKIMIVEDDIKLRQLIVEKLESYGYKTLKVTDFSNIKSDFIAFKPDLVLMDINLPKYDGFFWCRELRGVSNIPIIFLSARNSDMDQVMAIENGGDDYITKPFSFDLLLAKIKSVLRRSYGEYSEQRNIESQEYYGLYLYPGQNTIEKGGQKIELTNKEFNLLNILIKNMDTIVSREELLTEIWDDIDFVDDNTLSVNINRLRKKLEDLDIFEAIETKRGQGYLMTRKW